MKTGRIQMVVDRASEICIRLTAAAGPAWLTRDHIYEREVRLQTHSTMQ